MIAVQRVEEPWGFEEILYAGSYLVKRLVLRDGTPTHYHTTRNEVLVPVAGKGLIYVEGNCYAPKFYTPFVVFKGQKHRIVPLEGYFEVVEVSDRNVEDVVSV